MRALTTSSTLWHNNNAIFPRCYTHADSSTPASNSYIFYNTRATTGACGYSGWKCACQCSHPSPPSPSPPPTPPPPPDMCECTGDGNKISCSGTGVRYCGSGEECFAKKSHPFGQWSDLCAEMCACTGVGNQMRCSVAGVRYCGGGEECFAEKPHPFGRWGDLCRQSGRRLQQSSA
jgi:hypothetical protein